MPRTSSPSTVLYLANAAKIGGGARVLMDLMLNLDRERFRPVIVAPGAGALTEWAARSGIPAYTCADGDWQSAAGLARRAAGLLGIMLRERPAIAHAAAPTCYRALGLAARMTRTATVVHLGFPPEAGELERSFLFAPDAVIGCYQGQAADHADEIRVIRQDCRVVGICNGVDTTRFAPREADSTTAALRRGASQVVAIVGHISDVKGHPTFVEAAGLLAERFPGARFLALGGETLQQGLQPRLEARARELGLGGRLDFLGFRSDVQDVLAAVDVVVMPSHAEGFPLAVLEAMSSGKAVIATPVGGVAEAVVDGVTGRLVQPGNPAVLAEAVAELLENPAVAAAMGRAARERVLRLFSMPAFVTAVQGVYRDVVSRRAA